MTAYTSAQSGLWSASTTWTPSGHPSVNGDTFTIASGHTVTQDTDFSGLTAGFGASTITGALINSQSSTNILQMNGNLSGAGTITYDNGSGGGAPLSVVSEILMRSGSITASGAKKFRSTQPTHRWVKLNQAANIGDTVLHVDTDITQSGDNGSNQWVANSLVNIDNINTGRDTEQRTIQSVTSTTITLTAGLTNAKLSGAYVILLTRNVKVVGVTTGVTLVNVLCNSGDVWDCELRTFSTALASYTVGNNISIDGVYSNGGTFINRGTTLTFSGNPVITGLTSVGFQGLDGSIFPASGLASGCSTIWSGTGGAYSQFLGVGSGYGTGLSALSGVYISGTLNGGSIAFLSCNDVQGNGATVTNNNMAFRFCSGIFRSCTFSGNTTNGDVNSGFPCQDLTFINCAMSQNLQSGGASPLWCYIQSINHNNVAGAYETTTFGGVSTTVSSPVYDSTRVRSYQVNGNSNSNYGFIQFDTYVPAGSTIYVRCYAQKSAADATANRPRLWLYDISKEPLQSGSPDVEVIMTDTTNTWQVLEANLTNNTNYPKTYRARCLVKNNVSYNTYFDPVIRVSSFVPMRAMEGAMA